MHEQPEETELLLALLSSLIDTSLLSHADLLGALADAGGNVHEAARTLNRLNGTKPSQISKPRSKRKRNNGLDDWVTSKKRPGAMSPRREPVQTHRSASKPTGSSTPGFTADEPIFLDEDDEEDQALEDAMGSGTLVSAARSDIDEDGKPSRVTGMKSTKSLMSVLKQAPTERIRPKLLPRTLGTAALVAQYTPCTMHSSILPPELACRLFYAMLGEATSWSRNKWWLVDRLVESPHKTSFYARNLPDEGGEEMKEAARYWYNGRPSPPPSAFLPEMEEACEIIERTVNDAIKKRGTFFPLEWPVTEEHPWKANVAAANCYTGSKETVGFHSDQLTYLGPCPTIASLSLGTTRTFRLREVIPQSEKEERNAQTFNIPVTHNSLLIMHASCQERFKHAVPPQQTIDTFKPAFPPPAQHLTSIGTAGRSALEMMPPDISRINITFRFYRPDFTANTIPRCHCGFPTVLRPDMKRKYSSVASDDQITATRYFWMCYAGAQNDGKGCSFFQILDMEKEVRGLRAVSAPS